MRVFAATHLARRRALRAEQLKAFLFVVLRHSNFFLCVGFRHFFFRGASAARCLGGIASCLPPAAPTLENNLVRSSLRCLVLTGPGSSLLNHEGRLPVPQPVPRFRSGEREAKSSTHWPVPRPVPRFTSGEWPVPRSFPLAVYDII